MNDLPRFWFGQAVTVHFFSEDNDREFIDSGVIVGLCWKVPDFLVDGWWYAIELSHIDSCHWLQPGYVDWAKETQIRLVEQPQP